MGLSRIGRAKFHVLQQRKGAFAWKDPDISVDRFLGICATRILPPMGCAGELTGMKGEKQEQEEEKTTQFITQVCLCSQLRWNPPKVPSDSRQTKTPDSLSFRNALLRKNENYDFVAARLAFSGVLP